MRILTSFIKHFLRFPRILSMRRALLLPPIFSLDVLSLTWHSVSLCDPKASDILKKYIKTIYLSLGLIKNFTRGTGLECDLKEPSELSILIQILNIKHYRNFCPKIVKN